MADDLVLPVDMPPEEVPRLSAQPGVSCAVCGQVVQSLEGSWKKPHGCDHDICIACFSLCAAEPPRCPVAGCESLRRPETHQAIDVDDGSVISVEWRNGSLRRRLEARQAIDVDDGSMVSVEWRNKSLLRRQEAHQAVDVDDGSVVSVEWRSGSLRRPETCSAINVDDGSLVSVKWRNGSGRRPEARQAIDVDDDSVISVEWRKGSLRIRPETRRAINVDDDSVISVEWRDSTKGKEPLNDDAGQEQGESSRLGGRRRGMYCTICMETVCARNSFHIAGCTHSFCVCCIRQYVAAKVEDNVLSIGCPNPECTGGALHPEACRDVIPPQLFERWGAALCDAALGALKFYCPFKDCSALLVDDPVSGEAAITNAECPHCRRIFCAQCKVAWHDGINCAEFQRLGEDERTREDLLLRKVAQESKWQRCPKCKMYVERVSGCVYIVCRCGLHFCYLCSSPMTPGHHHCTKCKRTW